METTAALETIHENRSSIELKRNAKGEMAWDVKLYFTDGAEDDALARLQSIDARLRAVYLTA